MILNYQLNRAAITEVRNETKLIYLHKRRRSKESNYDDLQEKT